jgi:hypothetical protein
MKEESEIVVHRRRILLEDGRYLIFFTFADKRECAPSDELRTELEATKED